MKIKKYLGFGTEDFVLDDDFLEWVRHPAPDKEKFWVELQEQYPELKGPISEAIIIIRSFQVIETPVPSDRLELIRDKIGEFPASVPKSRFFFLRIAAGLFLVVALCLLAYYQINRGKTTTPVVTGKEAFEKGKLILADGTVTEFDSEMTHIRQTAEGKVTLNNDTIIENLSKLKSGKVVMNQLIIPYGKRSDITMTDGTRIWLNSGSQLSYPAITGNYPREVYLSGEAFFDVAGHQGMPFIVNTGEMKIRVKGTKFNVSSYENDPEIQVVLIEGRVTSNINKSFSKPVDLAPEERIVYEKTTRTMKKDKVDTELYSSWINGYLIFRNEPVSGIFRKLERYYDRQIMADGNMDNVTFSGKLDLKDDFVMVLTNISYTASFNVTIENNIYTIKK